jgi:hypothetical protein
MCILAALAEWVVSYFIAARPIGLHLFICRRRYDALQDSWHPFKVCMPTPMISERPLTCSCRYKRAFELTLKKSSSDSGPEEYPREYVNHFNGFLMDICNLVWRNRAFKAGGPESKQDQNAHGCTLPE